VNRAVLRPDTGGPGWFGFGADELRQAACLFLIALTLLGAYLVSLVPAVVLAAIVGIVAQSGHALGTTALLTGLVVLVSALGVFVFLIWLAVRLSLASPLTFDTRRVRVFGSFALTRGRFWSLLGAYLLAAIVYVALSLVLLVLVAAVAYALGGGTAGLARAFRPHTSSFGAYFGPTMIVQMLVGAALAPVQVFLLLGAPAAAYAQLTRRPVDVF